MVSMLGTVTIREDINGVTSGKIFIRDLLERTHNEYGELSARIATPAEKLLAGTHI